MRRKREEKEYISQWKTCIIRNKREYTEKIDEKETKFKHHLEKTLRHKKLEAELNKIKHEERLEEAKRLEKAKSYKIMKKKQEIEEERIKNEIIRKEKENIEVS